MAGNTLDGLAVFVQREALGTEGHTLVQLYVVADDAGLADYHTRTMVDGKITAYFRSRMDIDSCFTMRHLGDDAGNEGDTQLEQFVCNAVVADGSDGRITADDFAERLCGGVTIVGSLHICGKHPSHGRQVADEFGSQ